MKTKKFFILFALVCSLFLVTNVNAHDVNGDGYANWYDLKRVVEHFGEDGEPGWIPEDVNVDGRIDIFDLVLVVTQITWTTAIIDIWPDPIVVPAHGPGVRYITAIVELSVANVQDVDTASIELYLPVISAEMFIEGIDTAVIVDNLYIRAQFQAKRLIEYLRAEFSNPGLYSLDMTVVGLLVPGAPTFLGSDTVDIRII